MPGVAGAPAMTAPVDDPAPARGWLAGPSGPACPASSSSSPAPPASPPAAWSPSGSSATTSASAGWPRRPGPGHLLRRDAHRALAALGVGWLYDRVGPSVLYAVPVLVAAVPRWPSPAGWRRRWSGSRSGAGLRVAGLDDQGLCRRYRRGAEAGDGMRGLRGHQGVAAILGGVAAGWLYARSVPALTLGVGLVQAAALTLMVLAVRRARRSVP